MEPGNKFVFLLRWRLLSLFLMELLDKTHPAQFSVNRESFVLVVRGILFQEHVLFSWEKKPSSSRGRGKIEDYEERHSGRCCEKVIY